VTAIAAAVDTKYLVALGPMLRSLDRHLSAQVSVYLACASDDAHILRRRIRPIACELSRLDVTVVTYKDCFSALPERGHISRTTYARLLLPYLLPDEARLLYLDADTLVLSDVRPLLEQPVSQCLGAVQDLLNPRLGSPTALGRFGLPRPLAKRRYFNAGVLLLNLDAWREEHIAMRAFQVLRAYSEQLRFLDQDALNLVVQGCYDELDRRWNVFPLDDLFRALVPRYYGRKEVRKGSLRVLQANARILHFVGPLKPWDNAYPPDSMAGQLYRTFL
jgi:lipopolysaccharide biosynthesis glycosyltransferase